QFLRQIIPKILFEHVFLPFYVDNPQASYYNKQKHRGAEFISNWLQTSSRDREQQKGPSPKAVRGTYRPGSVTEQGRNCHMKRCGALCACNMILYCILCRFSSRFFCYLCKNVHARVQCCIEIGRVQRKEGPGKYETV